MGRGRLRRGYSLEVIFEEDPDFCSHLDSLDSVAIRFGVKEADDTISVDSLVEEYQIRFQASADKEHVFRSLDGIWDVRDMDSCFVEWDDFSTDTISKMPPGAGNFETHNSAKLDGDVEIASNGNGRRSRVSRRQIVEASWVFDSSDDNENDSGSNDDVDSTGTEVEMKDFEPEIKPTLIKNTLTNSNNSISPTMAPNEHNLNARFELGLPVDIRLRPDSERGTLKEDYSPPRALFGNLTRIVDGAEKDNLDSYISTRTDDTETNAYTFADPFNDTSSVASTAYESSGSTTSSGSGTSVCTVNCQSTSSTSTKSNNSCTSGSPSENRSKLSIELQSRFSSSSNKEIIPSSAESVDLAPKMGPYSKFNVTSNNVKLHNQNQSPGQVILSPGTTDVKKVRALFEINNSASGVGGPSRKSSWGEESTSSSSSGGGHGGVSSSHRLYVRNPGSPTNSTGSSSTGGSTVSVGGVPKKLRNLIPAPTTSNQAVGKILRSAFSQFNLTQSSSGEMDFSDLLVNDKIVIEDSPDIFQTLRNNRFKDLSSKNGGENPIPGFPTLRRSRSMGTGISAIESNLYPLDKFNGTRASRTSIIAEEMPAPDTVKNVRTVFEQILKTRNKAPKNDFFTGNSIAGFPMGSNSISIIKKSLSSVKSNPTSKIYRSESMRDDFPTSNCSTSLFPNRRFGKPILLNESVGSTSNPASPIPLTPGEMLRKPQIIPNMVRKHPIVERKYSEPIKFSPKINSPVRSRDMEMIVPPTLTEEEMSLLSSINDDDNPPKFVSPEVLQRIRSCGTTTTFFGGQVIAQSIKNRKLPISRTNTIDYQDYNQGGDYFRHSPSACSSSNGETPTPTSTSTSSSRLDHRDTDEFFTPTPSNHDMFSKDAMITEEDTEDMKEFEPPKYQRRLNPMELDEVFGLHSKIDTKPRIISVVPKSPSSSPTKSASPVGSIIEGRGTPEGCEGQEDNKCQWINEIPIDIEESRLKLQDGNNNEIDKSSCSRNSGNNHVLVDTKFSQVTEGAWF